MIWWLEKLEDPVVLILEQPLVLTLIISQFGLNRIIVLKLRFQNGSNIKLW